METKTSKMIKLIENKDWKKALSIASNFRMNFTKEEKRNIEIAYESMTGKDDFYKQLGFDVDLAKEMAIITLIEYSKNRN